MAERKLALAEITAILGCAKATASYLRAGQYGHPSTGSGRRTTGQLALQYQALLELVEKVAAEQSTTRICRECPREDCLGCRIAEMTG